MHNDMKLTGIIFNTSYIVAVIKLIYYIMKKIETNIKKYAVKYKKFMLSGNLIE